MAQVANKAILAQVAKQCRLSRSVAKRLLSNSGVRLSSVKDVVVVSGVRTPIGSFLGALAPLSGVQLGSMAIVAAMERAGITPDQVDEVYMGNVVSAGMQPAPAKQASLAAGVPVTVPCTTINKVCASGLKSIMMASQSLALGHNETMVAGGMESMSNIPYILQRGSMSYGGMTLHDGILWDALIDPRYKFHMGNCAENTAKKVGISREEQDDYTIHSYTAAANCWKDGTLAKEVVPVTIKGKKGDTVVSEDEEYKRIKVEKVKTLRTAFMKEGGTVTAANASSINDGASACILMTADKAKELGKTPLARIVGYGDAALDPIDFPLAPIDAMKKVLKNTGLSVADIDQWEINEAFAVVVLACAKSLGLDMAKVNPQGGAVSLGHPIGMSGNRLVVHLCHVLKPGQKGMIGICNGGGGAGALCLEKL